MRGSVVSGKARVIWDGLRVNAVNAALHEKYSNRIKRTEDGKIFPRKDAKAQRKALRNAAALRAFAPLCEKFFRPTNFSNFSCKPG
jgi:hypothetical protein